MHPIRSLSANSNRFASPPPQALRPAHSDRIQTALAAPDQFGLILAGGIAAWFGVQAIVNLGGVVGLMPVTGLTLPFFSAGGTSLFTSMVAAGLLLNVARRAVTAPRRNAAPTPKPATTRSTRRSPVPAR